MNTLKSDPRAVFFSTLMYRLLLVTYPKDFQREYASYMAQAFRDCCLRAFHTGGLPGMIPLWSLTLVDYVESVFKEYTRKGVNMNISRFTRLSGRALILCTCMYLAGLLIEVQISGHGLYSDPYNYYSRPIDHFLAVLPILLISSAMLLFSLGVLGLYQRFSPRASVPGKAGLVASMAGGVLAYATCITEGSYGLTHIFFSNQVGGWGLWDLDMLALFLLFGGIFIFGLDAVKRQHLPRWNFIPIIAGVFFPLRILAGYLQEATTEGFSRWNVDMYMINTLVLIITSIGLITLGTLMMSDIPQEEQLVMGKPSTMG